MDWLMRRLRWWKWFLSYWADIGCLCDLAIDKETRRILKRHDRERWKAKEPPR